MSSKNEILKALGRHEVPRVNAPQLDASVWIQYADPVAQFRESLEAVGGRSLDGAAGVQAAVESLDAFRTAKQIYSLVDEVPGNVDPFAIQSPHELASLDLCIGRGAIGVAENGAVWTATDVPHRVAFFLCQHLVLLLARDQIVHNMHQAYSKVSFDKPGFGVFISGPSKTADIEQSLVIGAHGARSMHVVFTDSA